MGRAPGAPDADSEIGAPILLYHLPVEIGKMCLLYRRADTLSPALSGGEGRGEGVPFDSTELLR